MGKRKLDFSTPPSKVQKLSAFGFSDKTSVPNSPKPTSADSLSVTPDCKTPSTRKFMDTWKFGRSWLRYDHQLKVMFCDICISAQVVNSFTTGSDVMKKESVTKHENRKGKSTFFVLYYLFYSLRTGARCVRKKIYYIIQQGDELTCFHFFKWSC